jgi:hypothetical protein
MASTEEFQRILAQQLSAMQASFVDALTKQQEEQKKTSMALLEKISLLEEEVHTIRTKSASSHPRVTLTPPSEHADQQPVEELLASGYSLNPTNQDRSFSRLSERLPDPPLFTGKQSELPEFLYQLENKLQGNADRYPDDESKLRYALSRIGKDAAVLVNSYRPDTLQSLLGLLELSYGDPNKRTTAQAKLSALRQGKKSFVRHFTEFRRLAGDSGLNEPGQIMQLRTSLNLDLKKSMVGVKIPSSLNEYATLISGYENDLNFIRSEDTRYGQRSSTTRTTRDPNAMEIDAVENSYAPVGSEERERRRKKHLCFKCGSSKHISPDCGAPIPTARIRTASLERTRQPSKTSSPRPSKPRRSRSSSSSTSSSHSRSSSRTSRRSKGKSQD